MLGGISSRSFTGRQSLDRSVENPPAFIPLGGAQAWPYAMACHWRSRLRIGHGKGVREQGIELGTLVTGHVSGATVAPWPLGRKPAGFHPLGWAARPMGTPSRSRLGRLSEQTTSGPDRWPYDPSGKGLLSTRTFVTKLASSEGLPLRYCRLQGQVAERRTPQWSREGSIDWRSTNPIAAQRSAAIVRESPSGR